MSGLNQARPRFWSVVWFGFIIACFVANSGSVSAQVVQLPTTHTFSYSGSVMVPDSGSAYLGGVNRSAMSSRRQGSSRSFGRSTGVAGASVSATIIDLDEMDRQIRGIDSGFTEPKSNQTKTISRTEEGKSLVRFARAQYRQGHQSSAFHSYQLAISVLDGRLQHLATVEFRRLFGAAADQAMARAR